MENSMPPMGDSTDARAEGVAAEQDIGEQQQDPNAGETGAQASLTAAADQNGTEAAAGEQSGAAAEGVHQDSAEQPDDELAAALGAFKGEVEMLKAALGMVGDRITAVEDTQKEIAAQFETVKADVAALNSADHGAPVQELATRLGDLEGRYEKGCDEAEAFVAKFTALEEAVAQLEAVRQAAPPDAEAIGKVIADLECRLNSLVLKLRHML
jgi:chromosome segregation ATPase